MRLLTDWHLHRCLRSLPPSVHVNLVLVVMVAVIHHTIGYRLPEYNETPTNVTYFKGERAVLQCSVRDLGTKQVIWKLLNGHVLTVGPFVYVDDPNFDIDHSKHRKEDWNLVIRDVQPNHAGMYECQISTKEDLQRHVQLNVLESRFADPKGGIRISGDAFVESGNRIVLTCNATGENMPPDDIDWFKDGTKLKQDQNKGITIVKFRVSETKTLHSQLEIEHSDVEDGGNYICRSSDLLITSKTVMVLNAETKPNKRDNGDPPIEDKMSASNRADRLMTSSSRHMFLFSTCCLLACILRHIRERC